LWLPPLLSWLLLLLPCMWICACAVIEELPSNVADLI
jgi:hypothetical protein